MNTKHYRFIYKRLKEVTILGTCLLCLYLTNRILNTTCVIKFFTGISCLGCGMSRALISFINGDITHAFHYHPLFWMVPLFFITYIFQDYFKSKYIKIIWTIFAFTFVLVYIYRLYIGSDIVTWNITEGFIFKFYSQILNFFK